MGVRAAGGAKGGRAQRPASRAPSAQLQLTVGAALPPSGGVREVGAPCSLGLSDNARLSAHMQDGKSAMALTSSLGKLLCGFKTVIFS